MNQIYSNVVRTVVMGALVFVLSITTSVSAQAPNESALPGLPQLSSAEQQQLEKEMASFQEEFNKLSPEEQESFYSSMEEAVQKIEEMAQTEEGKELLEKLDKGDISDEELDQLINTLVGEEDDDEEAVPEKEEPVEEKPKEPVRPKVVISSKQQQAVDMINSLIIHTNAFLVKVATMPEFTNSVARWIKNKTVILPESIQTWGSLKKDVEQFVSQLSMLLERDKTTGEYYHIDELIKHETLYNNLRKVQNVIAEQEPIIEETSPLHKKMSKLSKKAMQKMLNQYAEAIHTLKIPEELVELFKKFDPKALAYRKTEEQAALSASKARNGIGSTQPIIAGTAEEVRDFQPSTPDYPGYRRAQQQSYTPETPRYTPASLSKQPRAGKSPARPRSVSKDKDTDKKAEELGIDPELLKLAEKEDKKRKAEVDHLFSGIKDTVENAAKNLKTATLQALEPHLMSDAPVDLELVTELIPDTKRELSVRRGALGKIEEMKRKLPQTTQRKMYQTKLKKLYKDQEKTFGLVENQIALIENKFDTIKAEIDPEKLYAYFGVKRDEPVLVEEIEEEQEIGKAKPTTPEISDTDAAALEKIAQDKTLSAEQRAEKAVAYLESQQEIKEDVVEEEPKEQEMLEIERKLPTPISLFELRDAIRDLKKAIDTFDKPIEKKKAVSPSSK